MKGELVPRQLHLRRFRQADGDSPALRHVGAVPASCELVFDKLPLRRSGGNDDVAKKTEGDRVLRPAKPTNRVDLHPNKRCLFLSSENPEATVIRQPDCGANVAVAPCRKIDCFFAEVFCGATAYVDSSLCTCSSADVSSDVSASSLSAPSPNAPCGSQRHSRKAAVLTADDSGPHLGARVIRALLSMLTQCMPDRNRREPVSALYSSARPVVTALP